MVDGPATSHLNLSMSNEDGIDAFKTGSNKFVPQRVVVDTKTGKVGNPGFWV